MAWRVRGRGRSRRSATTAQTERQRERHPKRRGGFKRGKVHFGKHAAPSKAVAGRSRSDKQTPTSLCNWFGSSFDSTAKGDHLNVPQTKSRIPWKQLIYLVCHFIRAGIQSEPRTCRPTWIPSHSNSPLSRAEIENEDLGIFYAPCTRFGYRFPTGNGE